MSRSRVPDPLETALSWVWALGTAAGLAMVGSGEDVPLAGGPV
ncbi:hypothetical protein [Streptomyces sp. NPDC060322]